MLSVPAAELATSWLVPFVVQARTGLAIESITAVGDCLPVARVLSSASSPSLASDEGARAAGIRSMQALDGACSEA